MSQENIVREQLEKKAQRESATADMKQHADKLIQGFEAEDSTHPKRAIWELVQNARDLSSDCEIEIEYSGESLKFTHNGKPFESKTLLSLIKQVSSKSDDKLNETSDEEEVSEVGQYGTGFITTHAFGKRFFLNGSLKVANGTFITLHDFEINRKAKPSILLAEQLVDQQNAIFELLKKPGNFTTELLKTSFRYIFDEDTERTNASDALDFYTEHYIPIVMALNGRVKSIMISNKVKHKQIFFEKGNAYNDNGITVFPIKINGTDIRNIYTLQDKVSELTIILPLSQGDTASKWQKDTGRLFLYFPLIGTEDWGCNFLIHCGKFSPTEKRDGLHLKSKKSQTKEKEESNRELICKASDLIFNFLKENELKIANPIDLAVVDFKTDGENALINEYYIELKKQWVEKFREIKLVETSEGLISAASASFLDPVFSNQPEFEDAIYLIASKFWKNIAIKALTEQWTNIVTGWEDDKIDFITVDAIAEKIEAEGTLDKFDAEILIQFYKFLISINSTAFDDHNLLPNIKHNFTETRLLHTAEVIHPKFIEIADVIISEVPGKFILKSFQLTDGLTAYSRKQISKDWNGKFIETIKLLGSDYLLDDNFRNALIQLCCTFPSLDKKAFRGEIMDIITGFYGTMPEYVQIPNITDDEIEYDTPMRCLLKDFLYDIYNKSLKELTWVENNLQFVNKVLATITGPGTSQFEETIKTIPVFPNQNFNLKVQDQLQLEEDMPDGFKGFYHDVFHRDVQNDLIHPLSAGYLPNLKPKSGSVLAVEINDHFEKSGRYTEILTHPNKVTINKIIKKLTGNEGDSWKRLFPVISGIRETIMMSRVTNKEVKESMFTILDLEEEPDKIILLGDLAKDENMVKIIQLGKESLALIQSDQADFDFKKGIGVHIEKLLLAKIANEIQGKAIEVKTQSRQDGQDIVIVYGDEVIYYIEIKSRWSSSNPVSMSRNQIIQAVRHLGVYSLCVVDLVNFYPDETSRHYPDDISLILHLIRAVTDIGKQLKPLIETALNSDADADALQLIGEYRATVPKKVYDAGLRFPPFVDYLAAELIKILSTK
jgi:hypothetical protein